jgi:carboxyl-terminal processing protease
MTYRKRHFFRGFCLFLLAFGASSNSFAVSEEGYKELHIFSKVLSQIEKNYVEEVNDSSLIRDSIRGMLSGLDPHSVFMPPDAYKELRVDTAGKFGGIGVEVWVKGGGLTVVAPIEGTPAERAGLKAGDKIIKIDGVPTRELNLAESVLKMRGKVGSKILLTIARDDPKKPFDVSVERQLIKVPSVRSEILDKEYGYVKVRSFQERTSKDLKKEIDKFKREQALKGLVLDLRDNPGGLLDQAVEVADLFLAKGVIVSTESRGKEIDKKEAKDDGIEGVYPIVILVNGGTASASEIVAGALQDQARAMVLGTQTFGKGSVQTVVEMDDGSALKLTIALYFTPKGRSIQAYGIVPDIIVDDQEAAAKDAKKGIREQDLPGHLEVPSERVETSEPEKLSASFGKVDYQKKAALDYLKSWEIFRKGQ